MPEEVNRKDALYLLISAELSNIDILLKSEVALPTVSQMQLYVIIQDAIMLLLEVPLMAAIMVRERNIQFADFSEESSFVDT